MDKAGKIRQIWKDRFGDSRQWMTEVFSRVYNDNDALTVEADGRIVSSLIMRPMSMAFHGEILPVGYVYGAATDRNFQSHGYMSQLIDATIRTAYSRGTTLLLLHPARRRLFGFYSRFGFASVLYVDEMRYTAAHKFRTDPRFIVEDTVYDPEEISAVYTRLASQRGACLLHDGYDFRTILIDNDIDGGMVAVVRDAVTARIEAFALAKVYGGTVVVKELVASDEAAAETALARFAERQPDRMTVVEAYPQRPGVRLWARGMIRITDVRGFLEAVARIAPQLSYTFKITDPIIPENNGIFVVSNGTVSHFAAVGDHDVTAPAGGSGVSAVSGGSVDGVPRKIDLEASVDTLTKIMFSAEAIGEIFNLPTARPFASLILS